MAEEKSLRFNLTGRGRPLYPLWKSGKIALRDITRQGAQRAIDRFVELGTLEQKGKNKKYGRSFIYSVCGDIC
jgi:hypothetical protein